MFRSQLGVKTLRKTFGRSLGALCLSASILAVQCAHAEETAKALGVNAYGMPGLIEMPAARSLDDAQAAATISATPNRRMVTLTFQASPRLTGAFRYGRIEGFVDGILYDRSFDLQYQLRDENGPWPALALGLRDMVGTGVNSSEYVVATKTLGSGVTASAGLGWGRLGSRGGTSNPFGWDTRVLDVGLGGTADPGAWFHGPMAAFAGIEWQANAKTVLALEYSSDAHLQEVGRGFLVDRTPMNFGLRYALSRGVVLDAQVLHGSMIAANVTLTFNPKASPTGSDRSPAPQPFSRGPSAATDLATLHQKVAQDLLAEGLTLVGLSLSGDTAVVQVENSRFQLASQMMGRTARILSADLPKHIATFAIEPTVQGMPVTRVTLRRESLRSLQDDVDQTSLGLSSAVFSSADLGEGIAHGMAPRADWGIEPYVSLNLFDPDSPLRGDIGLQLNAKYAVSPQLSASGAFRVKAAGNAGDSDRTSGSVLPHVRSDAVMYQQDGASGLEYLTLDHFGKIAPDLFTHISAGYLEPMFAGAMAEILWKPHGSRLSLGAEVDHVVQRDTDKLFGVQDYGYQVTTGHLSAFYDLKRGYQVQVDAGRYLAGDWGSTLTVSRAFDNGWKIGVFATMTDVSFADFGEGSFDKGFVITAPLSWFTGKPATTAAHVTIRPILRDGGARLDLRNRLPGVLKGYGTGTMAATWGAFWR